MDDDLPLHLLTPRSCRMARAGLGILQKELAKAANVHVRTIKVLETGQARPQPKTATGILRAFVDRGVAFGLDGAVRIDGFPDARTASVGTSSHSGPKSTRVDRPAKRTALDGKPILVFTEDQTGGLRA